MAVNSAVIWSQLPQQKAAIERLRKMQARDRVAGCLLMVGGDAHLRRQLASGYAQLLLCLKKDKPCGECASCIKVSKNTSEDLILIEPQKNVIKIEVVREVVRQVALAAWSQLRIILIDEAQLLNPQAANALLKAIEEPPPGTHFILLSPSAESVLKTVRSRAQIIRLVGSKRLANSEANDLVESEETSWKTEAFSHWQKLLISENLSSAEIREAGWDKDKITLALNLWLEFSHDLWMSRALKSTQSSNAVESQTLTHQRFYQEYEKMNRVPLSHLAVLSELILSALNDIRGQVDPLLTLENLLMSSSSQKKQAENFYHAMD